MRRILRYSAIALVVVAVLAGTAAVASTTIHEGAGVGKTRLGWGDRKAARSLSRVYKVKRDTSYSYVVYHWYVGKRMRNKRYPVELYAKSNRRVYRYHVNSPAYVTKAGVKVGSSAERVRSAYRRIKGPYTRGTYTYFRLNGSKGYTEFYLQDDAVSFIVIAKR